MLGRIPNACRSHKITTIMTTAFKMDLIELAIGIYVLMRPSITPTIIRTTRIVINDMITSYFLPTRINTMPATKDKPPNNGGK